MMNPVFVISAIFMAAVTSAVAKAPNVLLICVDDLRPELACYGASYIHSPHIDSLADEGLIFDRHYVQAPTCGASRYALLTGTYGPAGNNALMERGAAIRENTTVVPPSLPALFRESGYETISIGKVSHHPGGWGGSDWDDRTILEMPNSWDHQLMPVGPWQHPRGAMHGLANGEIRTVPSEMAVYQATEGDDRIYPDGLITESALLELDRLQKVDTPFFLAVGIIRPHLPFGAPARYLELYKDTVLPEIEHPMKPTGRTTWHKQGEFNQYQLWGRDPNEDTAFALELRRHYAACVSYADAQIGKILDQLETSGLAENTVVVLWGDHGWHLGEHAIWGKHALFEESLRSPLIIRVPGKTAVEPTTDNVVETIDIFPTLCELAGLEIPDYLDGKSLVSQFGTPSELDGAAVSYRGDARTIRTRTHRLILHKDGFVELYDHTSPEKETRNIAENNPEFVSELERQLEKRLGSE